MVAIDFTASNGKFTIFFAGKINHQKNVENETWLSSIVDVLTYVLHMVAVVWQIDVFQRKCHIFLSKSKNF